MDQRQNILESHRKMILQVRDIEKRIEALLARNDPHWKELEEQRSVLVEQIEPLIGQYWELIPAVELSKCPFCRQPLLRRFDSHDLNGFWWMDRTQRPHQEPKACEHFCLLSGAVNLNGHPFKEGLFECDPGPQMPFVFPRLLRMPSMAVVISGMGMSCGYLAFPIAYFSEQPVPSEQLTQSWARKELSIRLADGRSGWDIKDDKPDFDLKAWIPSQKIFVFRGGKLESLQGSDPILKITLPKA